MSHVTYRRADVDGLKIFYREAGTRNPETILLLHGFPTAGHMFRDLIPLLAQSYHVVAPDLPGFGQSDMPSRDKFSYTFANIAKVIARFVEGLKIDRFAIYIFDYGAPVGLSMALAQPERITAIVSQSGNAYEEGMSDDWNPIRAYWSARTQANRDALRAMFTPQTTYWQYTHGTTDAAMVSPDGYSLDDFYLERSGAPDVALDLLLDLANYVALYPRFQAYFRERQPPLLAVWGKNDPFFLPSGAEAFRRDIRDAQVQFFDTGHFALETHHAEIASAIIGFLSRKPAAVR